METALNIANKSRKNKLQTFDLSYFNGRSCFIQYFSRLLKIPECQLVILKQSQLGNPKDCQLSKLKWIHSCTIAVELQSELLETMLSFLTWTIVYYCILITKKDILVLGEGPRMDCMILQKQQSLNILFILLSPEINQFESTLRCGQQFFVC